MVEFLENQEDIDKFKIEFNKYSSILYYISCSDDLHPVNQKISSLFIKLLEADKFYIIGFDHPETIPIEKNEIFKIIKCSTTNKFVIDKKSFIQVFGEISCYDINILKYFKYGENFEFESYNTKCHDFIKSKHYKLDNLNRIIPILKHFEKFEWVCCEIKETFKDENLDDLIEDKSYLYWNNILTETLNSIEKNGIAINKERFCTHFKGGIPIVDNLVHTQYNLFSSTGRPSNRFGGINYSALNKENGCRESFISRYGKDGCLVMFDYSSFHPRIISNLINYKISLEVDIYAYLAKYYFETDLPTPEQIKNSKIKTFEQLYGGIKDEYLHIEFFKKTKNYIDHRWKFFSTSGYVETPIYNRKIKTCHIADPYPNKLMNYIIQAVETEIGISAMSKINKLLEGKLTKLILYTYDSILLDFNIQDGKKLLKDIKKIMIDDKYPVKSYVGQDYMNMKLVNI